MAASRCRYFLRCAGLNMPRPRQNFMEIHHEIFFSQCRQLSFYKFSTKNFKLTRSTCLLGSLITIGSTATIAGISWSRSVYKRASSALDGSLGIGLAQSSSVLLPGVSFIQAREVEHITRQTDTTGLKLTLYQYQVCPFCCKVRAFLDYHGLSYNIVEVDPIFRKEIKFSEYRKVPILVYEGPEEDDQVQMNDSSVIISALKSFLVADNKDLRQIVTFFPKIESQSGGWMSRKVVEYANRHEIMLGIPGRTKEMKRERKWRIWVDDVLVHNLPPNIYRTWKEAVQAFSYIAEKANFNSWEKYVIQYVGALGMYFVSKKLKKKYNLPDDVRSSLYNAANDWMKSVGNKDFHGGVEPNMADLAVYGVLSSIEGLDAFNDMVSETNIGPWYHRTKDAVVNHRGAK
ncbi:prostaglandin E synthase 2-like [Anneissia japonica]|uniref:prostaglandin E synthase 2-like n=1 Tax=Anneissia japonica TaxID=1529436 RepID=UPI001425B163|nr:prostaglandin E synthase 2-like [Anneissia japonica]